MTFLIAADFLGDPSGWIQEIFGGILTSILFFAWFYSFKPRIEISKQICKRKFTDKAKEPFYSIKVINHSYFKLVDIRFSLVMKMPIQSPGGKSFSITEIECIPTQLIQLSPKPFKLFKREILNSDEYAAYAFIVNVRQPLQELWTSEKGTLEFSVHAKHGYSGRTVVISEPFTDCETSFKVGKFKHGLSTEIKPLGD